MTDWTLKPDPSEIALSFRLTKQQAFLLRQHWLKYCGLRANLRETTDENGKTTRVLEVLK